MTPPPSVVATLRGLSEKATKGPWEWRPGHHTDDPATTDAEGIVSVAGTQVLFPTACVDGDPYWVERFRSALARGRSPISVALDLFGSEEDKALIIAAVNSLPALLDAVEKAGAVIDNMSEGRMLGADISDLRAALARLENHKEPRA